SRCIIVLAHYSIWTLLYFDLVVAIVVMNNFMKSDHGRACISIREDEIAAESMGVNVTYYKVLAFIIGAIFAGIAGALYANFFYFIKPDSFGFMKSIDILVFVVFGGLGSTLGAAIGAIVLSIISMFLQGIPELRMVIYSVILLLIMLFRPQGLIGKTQFKFLKKRGAINDRSRSKESI